VISAFDWIFNDLKPRSAARCLPFLQHVEDTQPGGKARSRGSTSTTPGLLREETSSVRGSRHGPGSTTPRRCGSEARLQVQPGLFAYRAQCAGTTGCLGDRGYSMAPTVVAVQLPAHWRSATGGRRPKWPHLAYFPV